MLRTFVAICETKSFQDAASRIHRSPSAVSLQVAKLEEQLNTKLFVRSARRLELTQSGDILLGRARNLLRANDETFAQFDSAPMVGHLTLAAPLDLGTSLVPKVLKSVASIHPKLRVDVRLGTSAFARDRFLSGAANIAFFNDTEPPDVPCDDLYAEPLKWVSLCGSHLPETDPLPLAVAATGCAWRTVALNALDACERSYRIAFSSDTTAGQVAALHADLAIAALPMSHIGGGLGEVPAHVGLPHLPITVTRLASDDHFVSKAVAAMFIESTRLTERALGSGQIDHM